MDLESRVKAYAEEARRILLQRVLEAKGQKGSKAFWQGYTTNGNGVVKLPDGKYKAVKVIGNIVLPKESIVYIDEQNTVEVGFRKELPATRSQGKQQLKPTIADRIKRPLLLASDEEEVFGWIVIYHSESNIFNANNARYTWARCSSDPYGYNYQIYDYDSDTHANQQPATHGKCLRVSAVYAYGATISYGGTFFPLDATADATATLGSISASVSVNPPGGTFEKDIDFDYAIEETNLSQDAECEAETVLNSLNNNPHGNAVAEAETFYFQFPNAKIYLQWPDDPNGDANRITLDLNNYVNYTVAKFDRARNYVKLEDGATILYHTYSVGHVDTSAEADPVSRTSFVPWVGDVTSTWISFGKIYKGILHLRTNLSTGSTTSIYTPAEGYNNDDYLGYIYYNDNKALQIWDNQNLAYWDFYGQAIWQNAFDGDWISAFSGIAWDATAQANISRTELDRFLEISWDPVSETWNNGLNSEPPYSVTYSDVYYYDPATAQSSMQNQWLDGQPYYNDYQDIENLGASVVNFYTSTGDLPEVDDFVEVDMTGLSDPLLPNYQYKISSAETNYNDRISAAYISYQPYPGEQENGG